MKHGHTFLTLIALALTANLVAAQGERSGQIRGTVSDANHAPLQFVTVEVRRAPDNSLVAGTLTGAAGEFRITGLPPGSYNLRFTSIGFAALIKRDLSLTVAAPDLVVGRIELVPNALQLDSVTVLAMRREVRLSPEKNTYIVKDMPASTGGNAVDVLKNVPSVEVDGENNLSLRGNQNVVVQLNGRPVPMTGQELGNFLAQLPANMVEKVEVLPNPSAKYDPEGMAGIINVVLRQNAELGMSGGVSLTAGTVGQFNSSLTGGYQRGAFSFLGNYGFLHDDRDLWGYSNLSLFNSASVPTGFRDQDVSGNRVRRSHTLNGSGEYKLSKFDALYSTIILSDRETRNLNDVLNQQLDLNRALLGLSDQMLQDTADGRSIDYAIGYKRSGQKEINAFSAEARFYHSKNLDNTLFTLQDLTMAGAPANGTPALETNVPGLRRTNWTLQSDLTRRLGKESKLEAGYRGIVRAMDSDLAIARFSYTNQRFLDDPNRSNTFSYDEQVHAVYAVVSASQEKWGMQGGLRLERATSTFDQLTSHQTIDRNYTSFFPSALLAYNLDEKHQVKASYSKRIRRPEIDHMNPFTEYEDALDVSTGNPYLKPEYTHSFELGVQASGQVFSLQATPFFRHSVDVERRIRSIDETGLTTVTFVNAATSDSYGAETIGSFKSRTLSGFVGVTLFKQVTDGSNLSTDFSNNAFGWSARGNATWKLNARADVQTVYMYRAAMTVEQGRVFSSSTLTLSGREKLLADRLTVTLRANDVLRQGRSGFQSTDPRLLQRTERRTEARGVFLSLNYFFGQQPKVRDPAAVDQVGSQP